jgi:hypothetical protein
VSRGHGAKLGCTVSLSVSIKDRSLHGPWSSHRFFLSRAHTCLWEREGLLLSCHGLWLFLDRLIGGGDRWRYKHCVEVGPQVRGLGVQVWTGAWSPSLDGDLEPMTGVERVGLACA